MRNERRHAEIHALHNKGLTITAIAGQLPLNRRTVRNFWGWGRPRNCSELSARGEQTRSVRGLPCAPVAGRLSRRCLPPRGDSRAGYHGSKRSVERFVEGWRRSQPPPPVRRLLPVHRLCAGCYCDAAPPWTTPSGCC
jgi:hypothetical protein